MASAPTNVYGISIDTLSPTFAPLTDDTAILAQWVDLQFQTRLGFYWSAPDIGADLQAYILRGLTPTALARIPSDVQAALAEDERIASVDVSATRGYTAVGGVALNLIVTITPKDKSVAPFSRAAVASAAIADSITQGLGS